MTFTEAIREIATRGWSLKVTSFADTAPGVADGVTQIVVKSPGVPHPVKRLVPSYRLASEPNIYEEKIVECVQVLSGAIPDVELLEQK